MTSITVAAAQLTSVRGDVEGNLQQHLELVELAAEQRADWLVFPELSLIGYELDLGPRLAFAHDDARLAPLVDAASRYGMTLVVGAPIRLGAQLHIGAFIIAQDRTVEVYTKRHLGAFSESASVDSVTHERSVPPGEPDFFVPGDRDPRLRHGDSLAAIAICADSNRPAHARAAAESGATLYCVSSFVIPSELVPKHERLATYAAEHGMTVVLANYAGPTGGLASGGRSAIWNDRGELLAELPATGSGVVVAAPSGTRAVLLR